MFDWALDTYLLDLHVFCTTSIYLLRNLWKETYDRYLFFSKAVAWGPVTTLLKQYNTSSFLCPNTLFSEDRQGLLSFFERMELVLIPGEAFCWFDGLYSTVHFEVSSWDQSTSLQNGVNISRFWMANYQLDSLWHESNGSLWTFVSLDSRK